MAVYKDEKTNTWMVYYRVTDWKGDRKQSTKRGFPTKREALAWEREFLNKTQADLSMTFASFIETYTVDMKNRIKENTWQTKEHIIRTKILPYFDKLKISDIKPRNVIAWQNEMIIGWSLIHLNKPLQQIRKLNRFYIAIAVFSTQARCFRQSCKHRK
ncbi:MAG: hypothetical protein E7195_06540 [Peptococcaceae bacterium]|nr:hypothetical protein [Peptococcaceae bacterium]